MQLYKSVERKFKQFLNVREEKNKEYFYKNEAQYIFNVMLLGKMHYAYSVRKLENTCLNGAGGESLPLLVQLKKEISGLQKYTRKKKYIYIRKETNSCSLLIKNN